MPWHLLLVALMAPFVAVEAAPGEVTLKLPRPLKDGESVVLVVTVGVIQRGQQIRVTTTSDRKIGVISPYGIPPGQEGGSYVLPVPTDALRNNKLSLRLRITDGKGPPRAPTVNEVKSLRLRITPPPPD